MTAGIDLALALVEADLGADLARQVAKGLAVYHRRGGAQGQESALRTMAAKISIASSMVELTGTPRTFFFFCANKASPMRNCDSMASAKCGVCGYDSIKPR